VVHAVTALRALVRRHGWLRYLQIIPVGLVLWGTDAIDRFRAGAQVAGLAHAAVVNAISVQLGGGWALAMNQWLASHPGAANAAAWYYVLLQGTITGVVGLLLIWRRAPSLGLHRNALIACNLTGLAAFWLYPVAPPRMLPGYHDVTATAVPVFSSVLEGKAADLFASLPSLHVVWSLWVALAAGALLRPWWLRAAAWLYPAATIADVLATANHYLLDVITAPGVLLLGYAIASTPALARHLSARLVTDQQQAAPAADPGAASTCAPNTRAACPRGAQSRGARRPDTGRPDASRRAA
jgi:PAP2 superfamily